MLFSKFAGKTRVECQIPISRINLDEKNKVFTFARANMTWNSKRNRSRIIIIEVIKAIVSKSKKSRIFLAFNLTKEVMGIMEATQAQPIKQFNCSL